MLKNYLSRKSLVEKVLTLDELEKLKSPVNLMMGQTFDEGQPLDMLKYALFIMNLSDLLRDRGVDVTASWLIADHFISEINKDNDAEVVKRQAIDRINYLKKINSVYDFNICFVLSSELSKTDAYKTNLKRLHEKKDRNLAFREAVLKSVPEDRRSNPDCFDYSFEELATIQTMNAGIKVGPQYELFYDEPARNFASMIGFNKLVGVYLTNCWPLGNPVLDEKTKNAIENFGVLPYKKNSKGLGDYRIDPLKDDSERVKDLLNKTVNNKALIDLQVILSLARNRLEGVLRPSEIVALSKDQLVSMYETYVATPIRQAVI
ncbi:hypothetical protein HY837_05900 [archaeon]|nr:hypothetical protein [archaeon]